MVAKALRTMAVSIALLALLASIILLAFANDIQSVFASRELLSASNPIGLLALLAVIMFGGAYFFDAAAKIIKSAVK